jgi:hypothetical protein
MSQGTCAEELVPSHCNNTESGAEECRHAVLDDLETITCQSINSVEQLNVSSLFSVCVGGHYFDALKQFTIQLKTV